MRMLVLGAGLQGSACAYDLLQNAAIGEVRLADRDTVALPAFLSRYANDPRLVRVVLEAKDSHAVARAMEGVTAVMPVVVGSISAHLIFGLANVV